MAVEIEIPPVIIPAKKEMVAIRAMRFEKQREGWTGELSFVVYNEKGEATREQKCRIGPNEWNAYWAALKASGQFVYEYANEQGKWGAKIDGSVEADFYNEAKA